MSVTLPIRSQPMSELNTTPLIDILLVLLVMLILTLPPTTNVLEYPLPQTGLGQRVNRVRNLVAVTAGDTILWNGKSVTEAELATVLQEAAALNPEPELELAPDGRASYERTAQVLRLVKLSGATRVGFVGNERYRAFGTVGSVPRTR